MVRTVAGLKTWWPRNHCPEGGTEGPCMKGVLQLMHHPRKVLEGEQSPVPLPTPLFCPSVDYEVEGFQELFRIMGFESGRITVFA